MDFNRLIQIALGLVAVIVIINVWRNRQRRQTIRTNAPFHGLRAMGDENPFLGEPVTRVPGVSRLLFDLVAGRAVVRNVLRGETPAGEAILFDASFPRSGNEGRGPFVTVAAYRAPGVPDFQLTRRIRFIFGVKTVAFPSHPDFSRRFTVFADDEPAIRRVFSTETLAACEALAARKEWQVQAGSGWLLVNHALATPAELSELVRQTAELAVAISRSAEAIPKA